MPVQVVVHGILGVRGVLLHLLLVHLRLVLRCQVDIIMQRRMSVLLLLELIQHRHLEQVRRLGIGHMVSLQGAVGDLVLLRLELL